MNPEVQVLERILTFLADPDLDQLDSVERAREECEERLGVISATSTPQEGE